MPRIGKNAYGVQRCRCVVSPFVSQRWCHVWKPPYVGKFHYKMFKIHTCTVFLYVHLHDIVSFFDRYVEGLGKY